jgi:hypothetical protein
MRGPVPKRSDQRRRRNLAGVTDVIELPEEVEIPELNLPDAHPLAKAMYEALKESGQARYFEPSDWQRARLMCEILTRCLSAPRISSNLYAAIQSDMTALLMSEGDRRRVRLEIERGKSDGEAEAERVAHMAAYRRAASIDLSDGA